MKKKIKIYIILFIVLAIITSIFYFYKNKASNIGKETHIVEKKDLIQRVNVVSQVKPKESINLAFQTSGRVDRINFEVGEKIEKDDVIMELNNEQLNASLAQKRASLESARANLEKYESDLESAKIKLTELKKGSKPEEIRVYESKVEQAKSSLNTAQSNLKQVKNKAEVDIKNLYDDIDDILNNAYLKSDDAINYYLDAMFKNDNSEKAEITFITGNSQAKIDVESERPQITKIINELGDNSKNTLISNKEEILESTKVKLMKIRSFLNRLRDALNSSIGLSDTTVTTYKSNINAARTNINTLISNIETQQQLISSQKVVNENNIEAAENKVLEAKENLELAKDNLSLIKSSATEEQIKIQKTNIEQARLNIKSQKAKIRQIQAEIQSVLTSIKETKLISPIAGILVNKGVDKGEVVSTNQVVALVNSEGQYEIEANVPEMDISKVNIGDRAEVNLDAFKDQTFIAKVIEIAPAETIIDGLTTYETKLYFVKENKKIKSGMTADVDIITKEKKDVLVVPGRLIIREDNNTFVKKLVLDNQGNQSIQKVKVKVGIKGAIGEVEIIEGLKAGDELVVNY